MKKLISLVALTSLLGGCSGASTSDGGGGGGTGATGGAAGAGATGGEAGGGATGGDGGEAGGPTGVCDTAGACACGAGFTRTVECDEDLELERCACVDDAGAADHEAFVACSATDVCPSASAQHIEGGDPAAMHRVECIVEALRDRTPGQYEVRLTHTFSSGGDTATVSFNVDSNGQATVALREASSGLGSGSGAPNGYQYASTRWAPTLICDLKPASFFSGCLSELEKTSDPQEYSGAAWNCVAPQVVTTPPWFENCVEQAPVCD